jgi:exopolysaccharide biosynthesis polyprenyl glycosylphosphotransferase
MIQDFGILTRQFTGRLPLDGFNPSACVSVDSFRESRLQQCLRRLLSFTAALLALILCLPLIFFVTLAVRFTSQGPIFFKQTRVGQHGRLFTIYKFRTMQEDAETEGAVWATKNDPRVTLIGKFMRTTRIDEIPQLWNVLRGEMAFVGPRPERPEFVQWLGQEIPLYNLRHMIRPGITGWAQVRYHYGASLEETRRKLEYDLYYVKHRSIGFDLFIMLQTIDTILLRKGAQ